MKKWLIGIGATLIALSAVGDTFPSSFDLRTLGYVTPVKDQNPYGTCWAFGSVGALESVLKMKEGVVFDLSENHMINMPRGNRAFEYKGNPDQALAYLVSWQGPTLEAIDPYPNPNNSSSRQAVRHVQDVFCINPRTSYLGNDGIKKALVDLGALAVGYYHDDIYYSASKASYYNNDSTLASSHVLDCRDSKWHCVTLVGWNDNYSRKNFSHTPAGDGAFIVKNSWGSGWGDGGYFYVSYYDNSFAWGNYLYSFAGVEETDNYDAIYQYDYLGITSSFGGSSTTGWGAAMFVANEDSKISAVGFYALEPNTSYTVYVYTGCSSGKPRSGKLVHSQSGKFAYPGFHTVPFSVESSVSKSQSFSIVLKITTPNNKYPIVYSDPNTSRFSVTVPAAGQTFYSSSGSSWTDFTKSSSSCLSSGRCCFCCKAYTRKASSARKLSSISISGSSTVSGGTSAQFSCRATYSDGSTMSVTPTWTISEGSQYASVSRSGLVTGNVTSGSHNVTVMACYTENGIAKTAICKFVVTATEYVTITLDPNGGVLEGDGALTVIKDGAIGNLPTPTRKGYSFAGWWIPGTRGGYDGLGMPTVGKPSVQVLPSTTFFYDETIVASWTAKSYTVMLDRQGGIGGSVTVTATSGSPLPSIEIPFRTNYIFCGYYTFAEGMGTQYYTASGTSVRNWDKTDETTLYAKWMTDAVKYATINGIEWAFVVEQGTAMIYKSNNMAAIPVDTSGALTIPGTLEGYPVTRIGDYAFDGCRGLTSVTIPDGVTSIGECAFRSCDALKTVTYLGNCPDVSDVSGHVIYEDTPSDLVSYVPSGNSTWSEALAAWTWQGRAIATVAPESDSKLTFDSNGGVFSGANFGAMDGKSGTAQVAMTYGKGNYGSGMRAAKSGAAFEGWWTATAGGTPQYDANGKCVPGEGCWSSAGLWNIQGNAKLYARFGGPHALKFDSNGGMFDGGNFGSMNGKSGVAQVSVTCGKGAYNSGMRATMGGGKFLGWWTAKTGGSMQYDANGKFIGNSTCWTARGKWRHHANAMLYARWETSGEPHNLKFDSNGGVFAGANFGGMGGKSGTAQISVTCGKGSYNSGMRATRSGYTFQGWWTAKTGGSMQYDANGKYVGGGHCWTSDGKWQHHGNAALYAHWSSAEPHNLKFDPNGGVLSGANFGSMDGKSGVAHVAVTCGKGSYSAGMRAAKSGAAFNGWWTATSGGSQIYDANGKFVPGCRCWTADGKWQHHCNAVLYARWATSKNSSVTFNPNGGCLYGGNFGSADGTLDPATISIAFGSGSSNSGMRATRSGYMFMGWWTATSGGSQIYDASGRYKPNSRCWTSDGRWQHYGNAVLYARWLPITLDGNAIWSLLADGSWISGMITHNQYTTLKTSVKGAGTLTFHWKVSCEGADTREWDYLEWLVDDVRQGKIGGVHEGWTAVSLKIDGTGTHTIQWRYRKDGEYSEGKDCGWIRNVWWSGSVQ